jgi:hypothetical protein
VISALPWTRKEVGLARVLAGSHFRRVRHKKARLCDLHHIFKATAPIVSHVSMKIDRGRILAAVNSRSLVSRDQNGGISWESSYPSLRYC